MVKKQAPQYVVSPWVTRAAVAAILAVFAGGAAAWVSSINMKTTEASTINAVQTEKIDQQDEDFDEMKNSLRRIEDKIDDLK